jgi:FAD/FMN-containing dehydrogenase
MNTRAMPNGLGTRFAAILGTHAVCKEAKLLETFASDVSFAPPCFPEAIVYPKTRADVQNIVKEANRTGAPLIAVSSGPPHFRGDTVPSRGGAIVDFSRMDRIIQISPVERYARIEPGVTYGDLIPALRAQGLRLNMPLLPRASKSVVASRLEREPNLIPKYQYDYLDPLLTLEVVYGTGDNFRTGSACGPGTLETLKADKVNPWGPGSLDYFRFLSAAQGTMGLVTWAVTKAEVLPSLQRLYFIGADDVGQVTRPINELLRRRVLDECLVLNRVSLATILAKEWDNEFADLAAALPAWVAILCVAGYARRPEERMTIQERYLREICNASGVLAWTSLPGAEGREAEVLELISNVWTRDSGDWKLRAKGSSREIFFLAPISKIPSLIGVMKEAVAASNYPVRELGCYVQPMVQGRGCHCEFIFPCDESNAVEMEELRGLLSSAAQALLKNGAFFSRPYGPLARMVYENYPEGVAALKTLKGVFDPNNILNPGKLCF